MEQGLEMGGGGVGDGWWWGWTWVVVGLDMGGGGIGCWVFEAEHGSQIQSLFIRYCAAFKSPEHFACTHPVHLVHRYLTPRLVTSRAHTGQGYLAPDSDVCGPPSVGAGVVYSPVVDVAALWSSYGSVQPLRTDPRQKTH